MFTTCPSSIYLALRTWNFNSGAGAGAGEEEVSSSLVCEVSCVLTVDGLVVDLTPWFVGRAEKDET